MHMAATLEVDAVIDPAETRAWLVRGLAVRACARWRPLCGHMVNADGHFDFSV
jgi:acetyl-CoA carboxylase carboxyltransferase component